ncbi:MAG: hypothetical protein A2Z14_03600 [Chloroflexi bacterium RBG_16_48_8]|nr:MAG: hypothetical protein A2Z14_03600 [Chloroflexi bacterium RBG_16_48_8]
MMTITHERQYSKRFIFHLAGQLRTSCTVRRILLVFLFLVIAAIQINGISRIPFHPDEVSLLYQSRDFERFLTDPLSLTYHQNKEGELDQTYRVLNPPLPKYILAFGRRVAGFGVESVSVDWNWSLTWDENEAAGALPDPSLLTAARTASTLMVILSLPILYLCGRSIKSRNLGILALLLLGTHTLVLLHGRRAMAEGTLIFGVSLAILGILEGGKHPWLAGLGTAIAACAKMSAVILVPIGFLSVFWLPANLKDKKKWLLHHVTLFIATFVMLYLLFNPLLWSNPFQAIQAQWHERTQFLQGMVEEIETLAPDQILHDPLERLGALIAHLFISGPQFAESGNYHPNTEPEEEIYLSSFHHTLFRGWIGGGILLLFTLMACVHLGIEIRKEGWQSHRSMLLLLAASAAQTVALLWANPLPFQRYYVPLIPFLCIWISYFIVSILKKM